MTSTAVEPDSWVRTPRVVANLSVVRDRWALVVLAVAFALRLFAVIQLAHPPEGTPDPTFYWVAGSYIASGDGYMTPVGMLTAFFPPGYPYMLGALMGVLGLFGIESAAATATAVGVVQALLGTLTVFFVILIGATVGGRRLGLVAGAIMALWPNIIIYSAAVLSETLYLALFSAFVFLVLRSLRPKSSRWWLAGAAVALGAAALVRPQVLVAVPALAVAALIGGMGWRRVIIWTAALSMGAAAVIAPWTVRNHRLFDAFVPISTNGGANMCIGFGPQAWGGFHFGPECLTGEFYSQGPASELANDRISMRLARDWIVANPTELPLLTWNKLRITFGEDVDGLSGVESYGFSPAVSDQTRTQLGVLANVYYATVGGLALLGAAMWLLLGIRRRPAPADRSAMSRWAVLALTISGALVPAMFFGDPRFKVPIAPLMAVLAGAAAVGVWSAVQRRLGNSAEAVGATIDVTDRREGVDDH